MTYQAKYFNKLLQTKTNGSMGFAIPALDNQLARKLKERIQNIQLYAHRYSFVLNCQYSEYGVKNLLDFAYMNNLAGVAVHIAAFKQHLTQASQAELLAIKEYAQSLDLIINIDISSIDEKEFSQAVYLATFFNSNDIRLYIRESGYISEIIETAVVRLTRLSAIAEKKGINLLLEPHEDLKSTELMEIIRRVDCDNLKLLFDYGNMINAGETPLSALETMAPSIRHVHIKGVKIIADGNGFAHLGVAEREDDLPQAKMLFDLLMLGDERPQVEAFCLEEVIGYYAPAYRHQNENGDPFLAPRAASSTSLKQDVPLGRILLDERREAQRQVEFVQSLLTRLLTIAEVQLAGSD